MKTLELLPVIAIGISALSLAVSIINFLRDKGRVKATCEIVHDRTKSWDRELELRVKVANSGRRPITLNYLVGIHQHKRLSLPICPSKRITVGKESDADSSLGYPAHQIGVRLEEGQCHEMVFRMEDLDHFYIDHDDFATKLCIEDALGRYHTVHKSRARLKTYLALKREIEEKLLLLESDLE